MPNAITDNKFTGKTFGDMDVLNYHNKTGTYYVRMLIDGKYRMARASEYEILNNMIPEKIFGKLVENPFIHYDDGSTILYDINGNKFTVDTADFELIHSVTWSMIENGYFYGCIQSKPYKKDYLHRVIMGITGQCRDIQVDHKNWDKSFNRRSNLVITNNRMNNLNKQKNIENELRGIREIPSGYTAYIKVNGKNIHLGNRKTLEEAIKLRREAEDKYWNIDYHSEDTEKIVKIYENNELGIRGVRLDKRKGYYQARITVNKKQIYLGQSKDIEEAIKLRKEAEKLYFKTKDDKENV